MMNSLIPQFKIKSLKSTVKREHLSHGNGSRERIMHVPNFPLEKFSLTMKVDAENEKVFGSCNSFQENYKNRVRLHRKTPKHSREASLLDRLTKITHQTPLRRYKSRAFGSWTKVAHLAPN
jgi:hypothetical protein